MNQQRRILLACLILSIVGWVRVPAVMGGSAAEELTKRLPDGTIAFVATSGCDALKGDFEKTILGRICNDPEVRTFYQSLKTGLLTKVEQSGDSDVPQNIDMVLDYARLASSRPFLIGIAQVPVREGPPIAGFAILDAGGRKAEFTAMVSKIETMVGQGGIAETSVGSLKMRSLKDNDDFPLHWGWMDDHFVIAVNDAQGTATKFLSRPRSSAPAYLAKAPAGGDAFVVYCDYRKVSQWIGSLVREEEGEEAANAFMTVLKKPGLDSVGALCARVGFSGSDLVSHTVLEIPVPPTGLFAASKPVNSSWFRAVDARAMTASAVNWDLAGLYDTIMDTLKTIPPDEVYASVQEAISELESEIKVRIREELLASLAGPAVSYSLPAGATLDAPRGGFVVLAKLRDASLFEKSMQALGEFVADKAGGTLQISSQKRDDGRTVHVWTIAPLAMMGVMPTWYVAADHVVIGSSTGLCDLGAKQLTARGPDAKSLLDMDRYKKATAGLPDNLLSLTYADSQVQFKQILMQVQQVWPMVTMIAAQQDVKLPMMLPSLTSIAEDMGPSCSYSYLASDGLHSVYRGPGIESTQMAVAGGALGAGIVMPALARARQLARRMTSGTNLSGIGKACLIYANDYDDKFPPDLQTLVRAAELPAKCLESKLKPKDFDGPSYIYIPGQTLAMYPGNMIAYDNPEFCTDGVNVLFLDSHVEFMKPESFRRELKETCERLGRTMPEIRFKGEKPSSQVSAPVEASDL